MKHNDTKLREVSITQTVSLAGPPKDMSSIEFTNNWIPQQSFLPVSDDVEFCVKKNKKMNLINKGSITLLGAKTLLDITQLCPFNLTQYCMNMYTSKFSVCYSGMQGPSENWTW